MKTNLKTILILLIAIMVIGMLSTNVKAEYSAEVQMTPDKTEVNPGDTINVVVELVNIVDAGTGASDMAGTFEYDTDFFDSITASQGTWDSANGNFILSGSILTQDGQFAVLQLKVSDNATGTGSITFSNIITSNGYGEPSSPDITLTFNVVDEEDPGNTDDPSNNNTNTNDTNTNDTNTNGTNNANTNGVGGSNNASRNNTAISGNNTTTKTQLPYAGIGKGIFIAVVALLVVGIGSYALYRRYNIK